MELTHIADLIKETMGMDTATIGRPALANAVRARMRACGLTSPEEYHRLLLLGPGRELTLLIEQVVVPETWFFRAPEAFAALSDFVRNEWLPARQPDSVLRLLSAPCSTGEEPFSMAMALLEAGLSPDWFQIDALDISAQVLAQARLGIFGRNSFRGSDLWFREKYFTETPDGWRIRPEVLETVSFRQGNLVTDDALPLMGTWDAVFCRNVLIYFDSPTQDRVIRNLARVLKPEGLLFVGPSETFAARTAGFQTLDFPGAFACRWPAAEESRLAKPAPAWAAWQPPPALANLSLTFPDGSQPLVTPAVHHAPPLVNRSAGTAVAVAAGDDDRTGTPPALETATQLADSGQLPEALRVTENWLGAHPSSARGYCLLGIIRDAMGEPREAERQYRKALYLEPANEQALLHLAFLTEKQGDPAGALRLRERAQRHHATATRS